MSRVAVSGLTLGVVVLVYLGVVFLAQRRIMFPAPPMAIVPRGGDTEVVVLPLAGGPVEALYLAPTGGRPGPAPLLLFTHGNGELADDWVPAFEEPRGWGWAALLLEYPGYGRSAGKPSEASIIEAVIAAYDWARLDPRVDSTRIVPLGRSLGAAAASRLAVERRVPALVLMSPFTSTRAFAIRYLTPGFLVRDPFDNLATLRRYRGPLLLFHGRRDEIIPIAHGRRLAAAVPGAEFHELPCGHNDCAMPWEVFREFLVAHGLLEPGAPATRPPDPASEGRARP